MTRLAAILIAALLAGLVGCGKVPAPAAKPATKKAKPAPVVAARPTPQRPGTEPKGPLLPALPIDIPDPPPRPVPAPAAPLAGLLAEAQAAEFNLPKIDEARAAASGIRKLAGKHVTVFTDLPAGEVEELPTVFDAAVPLWATYFGVDPAKVADWQTVAHVIRDKERFVRAGLFPESLPAFPHGYSHGSQFWLYDQPSGYYRRHLALHEGTHCFMNRWLGGSGPPWYSEGMAELLGTHRWEAGKLTLAVMPRAKDDVPYWGRVKIVRDEVAAQRGLPLTDIMKYDAHAHLRNEPYGWCWAAAAFCDSNPHTQAAFRELKGGVKDRTIEFSKRFYDRLAPKWREITEDWQLFAFQCDYGYDFARASVVRKPAVPLPAAGATSTIAADRGWQSSGFKLEAGKTYALTATGRFQVATDPQPWPSEAGGITLHYHNGRPLGTLLAAVSDDDAPPAITPLAAGQPIGLSAQLTPPTSGTLYLCINEAAAGLGDNRGTLNVEIRVK